MSRCCSCGSNVEKGDVMACSSCGDVMCTTCGDKLGLCDSCQGELKYWN